MEFSEKISDKSRSSKESTFFDRDVSWLTFNERVLMEADRSSVPLMERLRFLSIYSSNLDEFYRVRVPSLMALHDLSKKQGEAKRVHKTLKLINDSVVRQLNLFGNILGVQILNDLRKQGIHLLYNEAIPNIIIDDLKDYFIHSVASFIQVISSSRLEQFFPENNKIYLAVTSKATYDEGEFHIVNIPSDSLPRFYSVQRRDQQYIVFLDDIIKLNLTQIFGDLGLITAHSFKITRDAELDLEDEFSGNLAKKIERKLVRRDMGLATRLLHEPALPNKTLQRIKLSMNLSEANIIPGGAYHNLKDLSTFPLKDPQYSYKPWPQIIFSLKKNKTLFTEIKSRDVLLHMPYHSYDIILRFFNEAAIDRKVKAIYVTLYRVANDSRIVSALISAAKNGKKVIVFVELKARFDEANNIKWSKKMKAAGVSIIESIPGLKVHAKLALVKRMNGSKTDLFGLLATGNFNENTARFYTDHILMTANKPMLNEVNELFRLLKKKKKNTFHFKGEFQTLLVGQFNLQQRFIQLIQREIDHVKNGGLGSIVIKFNNLEDKKLITKLYEASNAGVKISLVVRGICCLVPGVEGMSTNISVRRIVDRYLEHGRIFIFNNGGHEEIYLGSADWMNRNIYRRIEVCFPVLDAKLKSEIIEIVKLQLRDNCQAVMIDQQGNNVPVVPGSNPIVRSQEVIPLALQQEISSENHLNQLTEENVLS